MSPPSLTDDELFHLLGNDTRMAILQAFWKEFDVEAYLMGTQQGRSFTELRTAADVEDVGNFNYHLRQLEGHVIDAREDGYVLAPLGYNLLHAIEGHGSFSYWTIEPTTLEDPCPFCEGTLEAAYEREIVSVSCLDCDAHGDGTLNHVRVPAESGTTSLEAILELSVLSLLTSFTAVRFGRCPSCHASAAVSLLTAADEPDTIDSIRTDVGCRVRCDRCGSGGFGPAYEYALAEPSVQTFFSRQGAGPETGLWAYRLEVLRHVTEHVKSTDPVVVEYVFESEAASHRLTFSTNETGIEIEATPDE